MDSHTLQRRDWLWIAVAALTTILVRIATSDIRGFWMDEYQTLWAASLPLPDLVANRLNAAHSPLPFLWAKLFWLMGDGQVILRASSAVACGIAVVAIALLAAELGGRKIIPPLLVLCVFHPQWQLIGTTYRYMMPLVAVATIWAWLLARQMRDPTWRGGLIVAVMGGITLWTSGSAQIIWCALLIFGFAELWRSGLGENRRRLWGLLIPMAASLLSVVPFLFLLSGTDHVSDFHSEYLGGYRGLKLILATLFGTRKAPAELLNISNSLFNVITLMVAVAAIAITVRRNRTGEAERLNLFLLATLVGMFITVQVVSILCSNSVRRVRYQVFSSVPMVLLISSAWIGCRSLPRVKYLFRGSVVVLLAVCYFTVLINRSDYHRETTRWIERQRANSEPVFVIDPREISMLEHIGFQPMDAVHTLPIAALGDATVELLQSGLTDVFADVDAGFVMIYFSTGEELMADAVIPLMRDGFFTAKRTWRVGHMTVYALARTEYGAERIQQLPGLAEHRVIVPVH